MNGNPRANGSRGQDPYAALRLVALIAAITGVIVLAAAAFVLSYGGIHKIALAAGVSASMARIFPVIFDAMLVVSCAAVLSLRAASWWHRAYAWLTMLVLLAAVAAADALHATGTHIPRKPAAATIAVLPWVLLLLAFSLLLSMLRQFRRTRGAVAGQDLTETAAAADAAPAVVARPGLDILNRPGPAPQPVQTGPVQTGPVQNSTQTQPSAVRPAADAVAAREGGTPLNFRAGTIPAGTIAAGTIAAGTVPAARTPDRPAPGAPAPGSPSPAAPAPSNGTRPHGAEEQPPRTPAPPAQAPPGQAPAAVPPEPAAGPDDVAPAETAPAAAGTPRDPARNDPARGGRARNDRARGGRARRARPGQGSCGGARRTRAGRKRAGRRARDGHAGARWP